MSINILFTCAGRRNYLINYFKDAIGNQGKIFAADKSLSAPAMSDADVSLLVPNIDDPIYIDRLKSIIKAHDISAIISLNDLELPVLSKHKTELEALGTKVLVSNEHVIDVTFDKLKTFNFLKKAGLKTPLTYTDLNSVKKALDNNEIDFPLVVKPRWGSASVGLEFPQSIDELELVLKLQAIKLRRYNLNNFSNQNPANSIIIQEKIKGVEYGMDIVNDFNNNYFGTFARIKYSMRSGETDQAISVIDEKFEELGKQISALLKHVGTMDCDIFVTEGDIYVLELNPRFGGGYPFSHESGANIASIYIEWLKGNKSVKHLNNYKSGELFSKCDRLIKVEKQ